MYRWVKVKLESNKQLEQLMEIYLDEVHKQLLSGKLLANNGLFNCQINRYCYELRKRSVVYDDTLGMVIYQRGFSLKQQTLNLYLCRPVISLQLLVNRYQKLLIENGKVIKIKIVNKANNQLAYLLIYVVS